MVVNKVYFSRNVWRKEARKKMCWIICKTQWIIFSRQLIPYIAISKEREEKKITFISLTFSLNIYVAVCPTMKWKVPEFLIICRVGYVMSRVGVASQIRQPHVVAQIGENKCDSLLGTAQDPIGRWGQDAVLKKNRLTDGRIAASTSARNSMEIQQISIVGFYCVGFGRIAVSRYDFRRGEFRVWIIGGGVGHFRYPI